MDNCTEACIAACIVEISEYDAPSKPTLTMHEALGVVALEKSLVFETYKTLAEWLDCYSYILPESRILNTELIFHVAHKKVKVPTDCFKIWLASDILFTCHSMYEQERMLSWMKD